MDTAQIVMLYSVAYMIAFTIAAQVTMYRLIDSRGRRSFKNEQIVIARTRAFWAGVFSPVVIPAFILYHTARGLYKLVTVPFQKI